MRQFRKRTSINASATELDSWHRASGAFQRLAPPWVKLQMIEEPEAIVDGSRAVLKTKIGPIWKEWIAEHRDCEPGKRFTDVQIKGPFASWTHLHQFETKGENQSDLVDTIDYRLPLGMLGHAFGGCFAREQLVRTFRYRHAVTAMDLDRQAREPGRGGESLEILVTGATGMVGRALEPYLRMRGHRIRRVTRNPTRPGDVHWNPQAGELEWDANKRVDAVVHLAGENVASGRWTESRKRRILESRRLGTKLLCEKLAALSNPPKVVISASGANFYNQGTADPQKESSPLGAGFLSQVCKAWEEATLPAEAAGIRVVKLRLGVVLSPAGGALAKMLPAFQLGAAGRLGSGKQRFAWISLDDVIDVIHRAIHDERFDGAINTVSPECPDNRTFTKVLGKVLRRPTLLPVPAFALRLALGKEMADETLLADLALAPAKLQELGYDFRYPELEGALRYLLGR